MFQKCERRKQMEGVLELRRDGRSKERCPERWRDQGKYEIWRGGGDLIVEGQGRVTASNQLTVALHSSIWDTVSLCMHVCVFSHLCVLIMCSVHCMGYCIPIFKKRPKNTSLPSLFDPLTLALSILIIFYISVVFYLKKKKHTFDPLSIAYLFSNSGLSKFGPGGPVSCRV